jgi:hypothetical protein
MQAFDLLPGIHKIFVFLRDSRCVACARVRYEATMNR